MIFLKSESEIDKMSVAAQLVSRTLGELSKHIEPGITTGSLDRIDEDVILKINARPAFIGCGSPSNPFPATLCIYVNEEVVHGIPGKIILKEGDLVSIDCGVEKDGYFGDQAYSFMVGECTEEDKKLLKVTLESLYKGIEQAIHGNKIGDIGSAIQKRSEERRVGKE